MLTPPPPFFFKSLTRSAIQFVIVLVEILTIHLLYYYLFHLKKNKEKNSINHKRTNVINNFSSRVSDLWPVATGIWHISLVYNMKLSNQSLTWIKESELKLLILKWFMYEKIIFAFGRRMNTFTNEKHIKVILFRLWKLFNLKSIETLWKNIKVKNILRLYSHHIHIYQPLSEVLYASKEKWLRLKNNWKIDIHYSLK